MGSRSSKVAPEPCEGQCESGYCFLAIGNPGSGKSILLNSLIGKQVFKSGFSAGRGLTAQMDIQEHEGIQYIDTPGLADAQIRTQAAAAITEALQQHANYKILFVATMEGWSFRPQDKATVELVLDAMKGFDLVDNYGIVVNKLPEETPDSDMMKNLEGLQERFFGSDNRAIVRTKHVACLKEQILQASMDDVLKLPADFKAFLNRIPKLFIDKGIVSKVQVSKYAALCQKYKEERDELLQKQEEKRQELRNLRLAHRLDVARVEDLQILRTHEQEAKPDTTWEEGDEILVLVDATIDDITIRAGDQGLVTNVLQDAMQVKLKNKVVEVKKSHWKNFCKSEEKEAYRRLKVMELAHRGLTLGALLDFYLQLLKLNKKTNDFQFDPAKHTTADVVKHVIVPFTASHEKSYAETIHRDSLGNKATRMVSHTWGNLFTHLMAAIVADALDADHFYPYIEQLTPGKLEELRAHLRYVGKLSIVYWVCAFSVNQHVTSCKWMQCPCLASNLGNDSPLCEVNKFDEMMEILFSEPQGASDSIHQPRHVIVVDLHCALFRRAWVVAELVIALTMRVAVIQKYKFHSEESVERLLRETETTGIDVRKCQATREEDVAVVVGRAKTRIAERGYNWDEFHSKLHREVFDKIKHEHLAKKLHVVCIGNTGVGKSHILNQMIGKDAFTDNATREHQDVHVDSKTPVIYTELGGLADPLTSEETAKAITAALKKEGRHKLFIVVTLEAGRVRPDDAETILKVLEAVPAVGPHYNIIINKVEPAYFHHVGNPRVRKNVAAALFAGLPPHLQPSENIWWLEKSGKFTPGMLEDAAEVTLGPGMVQKIEIENEELMTEELRKETEDLRKDLKVLEEQLEVAVQQTNQGVPAPQWTEVLGGESDFLVAAVSIDGHRVVTGGKDKTVRVWDFAMGTQVPLRPLERHEDAVGALALSPDGLYIISGSWDCTLRVWSANTGKQVGEPLRGHAGHVLDVSVSPNSRHIVSSGRDKTVRVWDLESGNPLKQLRLQGVPYAVVVTPDGRRILIGSSDKTVRVLDFATFRTDGQPMQGHKDFVNDVAVTPDGRLVASGSSDGTVRIWELETRRQVGDALQGHPGTVWAVAVSADSRYVVGSSNNAVNIWDLESRRLVGRPLLGHTDRVLSVDVSPDSSYVVSCGRDKTLRVWHLDPKKRPPTPPRDEPELQPSQELKMKKSIQPEGVARSSRPEGAARSSRLEEAARSGRKATKGVRQPPS